MPPPAPQRDADPARSFGRDLQPPRSRHWEARHFADDGAEAAVAQAFLETGEHRLVVAALKIDDAIGFQARLGERRREQIRPRDAPQDLALGAGDDARCEQGRRGAIDRAVSAACYFVQSAEWETAARESRVQLGNAEWQNRCGAPVSTFDLVDLGAQSLKGGRGPHGRRGPPSDR